MRSENFIKFYKHLFLELIGFLPKQKGHQINWNTVYNAALLFLRLLLVKSDLLLSLKVFSMVYFRHLWSGDP